MISTSYYAFISPYRFLFHLMKRSLHQTRQ